MKIRLNLKLNREENHRPLTNQSKGPNLLQSVLGPSKEIKPNLPISKFLIYLIATIQIIFVLLVFYNTRIAIQIMQLSKSIELSKQELDGKMEEEKILRKTISKIETLKTLETSNEKFKPKVDLLLNSIPNNIMLIKSQIEKDAFSITIITNNAIEVSLLIDNYLRQGLGREIVIKAANLDITDNKFTTTLEVIL